MIDLINGDCLEKMRDIPDGSVDMILCDLPYGTTRNKWDTIIPIDKLFNEYWRVLKKDGVIVLTATQPFSSLLVSNQLDKFKYEWIWEKTTPTGHLNAKKQPMRIHESVLVFGKGCYNPQGLKPFNKITKQGGNSSNYNKRPTCDYYQEFTNYPRTIIKFNSVKNTVHPTQKPVALMEYLIITYTNEGEIVLDNCMGSGTTGVACKNLNRDFIGIEKDEYYFNIAKERIYG